MGAVNQEYPIPNTEYPILKEKMGNGRSGGARRQTVDGVVNIEYPTSNIEPPTSKSDNSTHEIRFTLHEIRAPQE